MTGRWRRAAAGAAAGAPGRAAGDGASRRFRSPSVPLPKIYTVETIRAAKRVEETVR